MTGISPTYGESVAIGGMALDLSASFSARLGRYPGKASGSLGMHVHTADGTYRGSVGDLGMGSYAGVTDALGSDAIYAVVGNADARFERSGKPDLLVGRVTARSLLHQQAEPPPGLGSTPVSLDAEFRAHHPCIEVRPGRIEVMGEVRATITTPDGEYQLQMPGKWHEQVGERPRFGPRFIYLNVHGERLGLLAIDRDTGAQGFAVEGEKATAVREFSIEPLGCNPRAFVVGLADGRRIAGEARIERMSSSPIEAQRRPGATVVVTCSLGRMVGNLNDWNPED